MSGQWHGGKGSRARPLSISQEEYGNRFDNIFGKKKKTDAELFDEAIMKNEYYDEEDMQVRATENKESFGTCGCGRSPTGKCIGWHGLTEEEYQVKLTEHKKNEESKTK